MPKHTLWKTLSCDLTPDEVATYATELAAATTEKGEIEAEKKEVVSSFAARINKCDADARVLARKVTTRKEDRQVECDLDFDYAKGMVFTVRTDTGVTVGQRKLTEEERQEQLDFEGEQDKEQAKEEKREAEYLADCQAMGRELETVATEIVETLPEPTTGNPEISVCGNTECINHCPEEPNGMGCIDGTTESAGGLT